MAVAVCVALFAAAQLIRPGHATSATDPAHTIDSQLGPASALTAVLGRSCGDCHSNATAWPTYTRIAPLSWVVARAENEGRKAVNFSEWTGYSPAQRRALLVVSCRDASTGKMPVDAYTRLRPAARLSAQDIETICAASRAGESRTPEPGTGSKSGPAARSVP
jgi:hypothetical protein